MTEIQHQVSDVPDGVYWSREAGNFYDATTNKGMGTAFYERWYERKDEFPERATEAPGLDIHLNKQIVPKFR